MTFLLGWALGFVVGWGLIKFLREWDRADIHRQERDWWKRHFEGVLMGHSELYEKYGRWGCDAFEMMAEDIVYLKKVLKAEKCCTGCAGSSPSEPSS